jgi:hypothetical protein
VSKKKRNPKEYGEIELDPRPAHARRPDGTLDRSKPHVAVDIGNLTVWAQRSVLGLRKNQLTPKEMQER